jgi:hypothetical protein
MKCTLDVRKLVYLRSNAASVTLKLGLDDTASWRAYSEPASGFTSHLCSAIQQPLVLIPIAGSVSAQFVAVFPFECSVHAQSAALFLCRPVLLPVLINQFHHIHLGSGLSSAPRVGVTSLESLIT